MRKHVKRRHVHMIQPVNMDMSRKVSQLSEPKTKKPLQNLLLFGRSCPLIVPFITYHMPLVLFLF